MNTNTLAEIVAARAINEGINVHTQLRDFGIQVGERRALMPDIEEACRLLRIEHRERIEAGYSAARRRAVRKQRALQGLS